MLSDHPPSSEKRTDVGYKRPPKEHQFPPGHKPAPRKKQSVKPPTAIELLIKILNEEQRVEIGGKPHWYTKARLLVLVAFQMAEKGNPTLSRTLMDLFLKDTDSSTVNEPLLQVEREDGTWSTTTMSGRPVDPECFDAE